MPSPGDSISEDLRQVQNPGPRAATATEVGGSRKDLWVSPANADQLLERPAFADALAAKLDANLVGAPGGVAKDDLSSDGSQAAIHRHIITLTGERFTVEKDAENPIFTNTLADKATIYWPWIVRVDGILGGAALGKYYMYFSTDHDATVGGCFMAYSDSLEGPWTMSAMNYTDTVAGNQTETPSVIWNPTTSLFHMFYQQGGVGGFEQATCLATSADGVTWTRYNGVGSAVVVNIFSGTLFRGNGHTGYFRPQKIGGLWYGYHLTGGGDYPYFGMSFSKDGINWAIDANELVYCNDVSGSVSTRVEWNMAHTIHFRGRLWWIGLISTYASGASGAVATLAMAPVSDDLRSIVGAPQTLIAAEAGWETEGIRSFFPIVEGGTLYLYYQYGNSFGLAIVTAEL